MPTVTQSRMSMAANHLRLGAERAGRLCENGDWGVFNQVLQLDLHSDSIIVPSKNLGNLHEHLHMGD